MSSLELIKRQTLILSIILIGICWELAIFISQGMMRQVEVYNPWLDLGMTHLNRELMLERAEDYLESVLAREP